MAVFLEGMRTVLMRKIAARPVRQARPRNMQTVSSLAVGPFIVGGCFDFCLGPLGKLKMLAVPAQRKQTLLPFLSSKTAAKHMLIAGSVGHGSQIFLMRSRVSLKIDWECKMLQRGTCWGEGDAEIQSCKYICDALLSASVRRSLLQWQLEIFSQI